MAWLTTGLTSWESADWLHRMVLLEPPSVDQLLLMNGHRIDHNQPSVYSLLLSIVHYYEGWILGPTRNQDFVNCSALLTSAQHIESLVKIVGQHHDGELVGVFSSRRPSCPKTKKPWLRGKGIDTFQPVQRGRQGRQGLAFVPAIPSMQDFKEHQLCLSGQQLEELNYSIVSLLKSIISKKEIGLCN